MCIFQNLSFYHLKTYIFVQFLFQSNSIFMPDYLQLQQQANKMGCQVVSVYADQTSGLLGYPETVLKDLYNRNFCGGNLLKTVPSSHQYFILGFNQSFAQGKMYTYVLGKNQFFVFTSGRFLVVYDCPGSNGSGGKDGNGSWRGGQRTIMHEDKIVGLQVRGKLALVGILGGKLILWDLQFFQQKLNIKLPQHMISISSLSFSQTYIFATDCNQPHHSIHCYQIRTGKKRSQAQIPSYQPALKGISWNKTHHITVAPDGVWFMNLIQSTSQIEVTKGMFRIFPKTSMTCLAAVDDVYIISGSVDGYVFLWAHYQCQKAMKVGEFGVSQMVMWGNKLVVGNFGNNVRVFETTIKKKTKMEEDELKNGEITQDFVSVIIDSYERNPLQSIVVSKLQPSIYYAQTRSGLLFNKMIPSADYQNKIKNYKEMDKKLIQFQKDTIKYIWNDQIWFIKCNKPFFQIQKMRTEGNPETWKIDKRFISNSKKYVETPQSPLFCLLPQIQKVCFVGTNKIYLVDIEDIQKNPDVKIDSLKEQILFQFEPTGPNALSVRGLTYFETKSKNLYLIFFFETQYGVFQCKDKKWKSVLSQEYEKEITKEIEIEGQKIKFEEKNHRFQCINNDYVNQQMRQKMSFMHCVGEIEDMDRLTSGKFASLGGGAAIIK